MKIISQKDFKYCFAFALCPYEYDYLANMVAASRFPFPDNSKPLALRFFQIFSCLYRARENPGKASILTFRKTPSCSGFHTTSQYERSILASGIATIRRAIRGTGVNKQDIENLKGLRCQIIQAIVLVCGAVPYDQNQRDEAD